MMHQTAPAAPPGSRTEFVLEAIKEAILSGTFRPGQALVEAELAASLVVSKTPVREALKTLSGSGLVVMSPYKGASVRIVDAELARSVYELRALLEPEALRKAVLAKWDFAAARAALAESMTAAAEDADRTRMSLTNRRFHRALYEGCGNPLMIKILDDVRDQTALITVAGWGIEPSWRAELHEHRDILNTAQAGEADRAAGLLRKHITTFAARVTAGLPDGS